MLEDNVDVVELWGKLSGAALFVQYFGEAGANQVGCQYLADNQRWSNILLLHIFFFLLWKEIIINLSLNHDLMASIDVHSLGCRFGGKSPAIKRVPLSSGGMFVTSHDSIFAQRCGIVGIGQT